MEKRFYDNDFEHFLQRSVKQHRMYPSDKIWRNIQAELHGKRSWPALTIITILVITALTISTILNNHPARAFQQHPFLVTAVEEEKATTPPTEAEQFSYAKITNRSIASEKNTVPIETVTDNTFTKGEIIASATPVTVKQPSVNPSPIVYSKLSVPQLNVAPDVIEQISANRKQSLVSPLTRTDLAVASSYINAASLQQAANKKSSLKKPELVNNHFSYSIPTISTRHKSQRFEYDIYITPSTSYRKLSDDKERNKYQLASGGNAPVAANYSTNVNDVVRHKPALGLEAGFAVLYGISKHVKLTAGLQFNVRQYYIDTYKSGIGAAAIAIVSGNRLDTVWQYSSFSNSNGYSQTKLDNKLYQISVPLGIQWEFFSRKRFGISAAGSIQPTYTLNKNLYIISTDYKFYTDGTPFLRKWNINSSAELDISYKVGDFKWHIGPQIRYQHLPTYSERYPIKEHRMDYGLKIGVTKAF